MFEGKKWGYSILAVANDNLEVLLILWETLLFMELTKAPIDFFDRISSQVCKIMTVFRPEKQAGPGFYPKMCWSPWRIIARNKAQCLLTLVHKGKIIAYRVSLGEVCHIVQTSVNVDEDAHVIGSAVTERHPIQGMIWYEQVRFSRPILLSRRSQLNQTVDDHWLFAYAIQCRLRVVAIRCDKPVTEKAARVWEFENEFLDPVSGNVTYFPHLGHMWQY